MNQIKFKKIEIFASLSCLVQVKLTGLKAGNVFLDGHFSLLVDCRLFSLAHRTGNNLCQGCYVFIDFQFVAVEYIVKEFSQTVKGLQHRINQIGRRDKLKIANHIQDIFNLMGKLLDIVQPQETAAAFYGVGRPENLIDQIFINGLSTLLDFEQIALNGLKMLLGFLHIHLQGFVFYYRHGCSCIIDCRFSISDL